MSGYNVNRNLMLDDSLRNNHNEASERMFFSKILRNISSWNVRYDDMLVRNKISIAEHEDPNQMKFGLADLLSQASINRIASEKYIPYLNLREYDDKRRILREYAIKDEIRDFISTICDESIIYDDNKKFCALKPLDQTYPEKVRESYQKNFEKLYNQFKFNDGTQAWKYFKKFLVDGIVAFEIVLDDHDRNVELLSPIDPMTLVPGVHPESGMSVWIQFPEDPVNRRVIIDSKIIYISYASHNEYSELSYTESLIRPYNQLKIIEQTRIMFNILNAQIYEKYTIPTQGLSKGRAQEEVAKMIADYHEEIEWDDALGVVTLNGRKHTKYNKQFFIPDGDTGQVQLELMTAEGHDLNEETMLDYFSKALKRASKIPFSRLDTDSGGGNLYGDAAELTRDEVKFANFIDRLRTIFKEIIEKPLKIQMLLDFPEYKKDHNFLNNIGIRFLSNDLFEEWKRLKNFQKRGDIVADLLSKITVGDKPYFHIEYLMQEVMQLSEEDRKKNEAFWLKDKLNPMSAEGNASEGGELGGGSAGDLGGGSDFEAPDFEPNEIEEGPEIPDLDEIGGGNEETEEPEL